VTGRTVEDFVSRRVAGSDCQNRGDRNRLGADRDSSHIRLRHSTYHPTWSAPNAPARSLKGQGPTKSPIVCLGSDGRHWVSRYLEQTQGAEKVLLFCSTILFQNRGMIYGYARVSTEAQDLTSQLAQLKGAGCEKVFREKITGTTADRPQLRKLMAALAHGDVVIIPAVDRLSRDTTDLLIIAREMQKAGAGIRSLAEPFLDTTSDFAEIVFAILGVAAKLERRRIVEPTARGRADAKGVKFGRKPTLTPHQQREAIKWRDVDGETLRSIARSYNVSPQTISRLAAA
jgi:DNA invertase Pin-like site-specific DNA recombinase